MSKKRIVAIILGCLLGVAVVSAIVAAVVVGTKQEGHSYSEEWAFDEPITGTPVRMMAVMSFRRRLRIFGGMARS